MDGVESAGQKRALDAVGGKLRYGKGGLLRMSGESREVRDRMHVPLVLQRQQQQRKHGEADGTTHGIRGFDSQKLRQSSNSKSSKLGGAPRYIPFLANVDASTAGAAASRDGSSTVMRHNVRASLGSMSVAECSSDALSHTTISRQPYLKRNWYFG